jgi:hypothetical protein
MKKITMMAALVAALMVPAAFGPAAADVRVAGEKLDSGLGELPATYTAAEYMPASWVRGESMDSGLGELPSTYTAAEYQAVIVAANSVGER